MEGPPSPGGTPKESSETKASGAIYETTALTHLPLFRVSQTLRFYRRLTPKGNYSPPLWGKPPKKRKRNPSFRKMLRNEGVDVEVRPAGLPPKRKRNQKRPSKKRAKKRKMAAAAAAATAANEANEPHVSVGSSAPVAGSSGVDSPVVAPSPSPSPSLSLTPDVSLGVSSSPAEASSPVATPSPLNAPAEPSQPAPEETGAENVVWDPVDPLGLFDELEGPLD
ncbi:hypothetical protein N7536_003628 [Penicillium majusculum]|uniref:Uncharacterized protein n=1 Tax=Penicillium solitum TaxID=60172 RepID=A0A1V6RK93_9EURO|nr:uncharacterized protein PENSOL_c003G10812 [Penicillium solitum]KAJ5700615.1 hypothetical protein N7536_003628 [Penicillium majusculum]OQE01948.1 hypothetical protein PENSOL_c003G10812 [Penicillium solitum]